MVTLQERVTTEVDNLRNDLEEKWFEDFFSPLGGVWSRRIQLSSSSSNRYKSNQLGDR